MRRERQRRVGERRKAALIMAIFMSFSFLVMFKGYTFVYPVDTTLIQNTERQPRSHVKCPVTTIVSNSSIAFYTIAGASQKPLKPDLRGKFWEFQMEHFTGNYSLHYFSDGPLTVNGIEFIVPSTSERISDSQFCIRTPETWKHFMKFNADKKWYFRGTHDTFVNMTALSMLMDSLEKLGDPMNTVLMAYNVHEWGHRYYPHGGTGWLFSNYAVKLFTENLQTFMRLCKSAADDTALPYFFDELGIDTMKWQTNKFIVTFPLWDLDIIRRKQYYKVTPCRDTYRLYEGAQGLIPAPARTAASIHMHRIPMDEAWDLLCKTPPEFAVFFPDPNQPTFCRLPKPV